MVVLLSPVWYVTSFNGNIRGKHNVLRLAVLFWLLVFKFSMIAPYNLVILEREWFGSPEHARVEEPIWFIVE